MEKVPCVDDDLSLLHLYDDEISEEGYKVILARDGQEALRKFEKESPGSVNTPLVDGGGFPFCDLLFLSLC